MSILNLRTSVMPPLSPRTSGLVAIGTAAVLLAAVAGCSSESPEADSAASSASSSTPPPSSTTSLLPPAKSSPHFTVLDAPGFGSYGQIGGGDGLIASAQAGVPTVFSTVTEKIVQSSSAVTRFNPECGMHVGSPPGGPATLYTVSSRNTEAAGLAPASRTYTLDSWSGEDLTKNWSTDIATFESTGGICSHTESNILGTSDGKWLVTEASDGYSSTLIDAVSGQAYPQNYTAAPLGRYIGAVVGGTCGTCENDFSIIDPDTMQPVAELEPEKIGAEIDSNSAHSIFINAIVFPEEATFYENGTKLAKASGGELHILDVGSGSIERSFPLTDTRSVVHGNVWVDEDGTKAVIREDEVGFSENVLRRIELTTGSELWRIEEIQAVCTASDTQVSVVANNQLILLDIDTGEQLDYTGEFSNCGQVFGDYALMNDDTIVKLVD